VPKILIKENSYNDCFKVIRIDGKLIRNIILASHSPSTIQKLDLGTEEMLPQSLACPRSILRVPYRTTLK
jgi:hypothetical protein